MSEAQRFARLLRVGEDEARVVDVAAVRQVLVELLDRLGCVEIALRERVRGADLHSQTGGGKTQCTEYLQGAEMNEIEDGKVTVIGPDMGDFNEGDTFPFGIYIQVAGREFQEDFEPILERQTHHLKRKKIQ